MPGIALWAGSQSLARKLLKWFGANYKGDAIVLRDESWPFQVSGFIATLEPSEAAQCLATEVDANGRFNPWRALPLSTFLLRIRTAWLPDALRSKSLKSYLQPIVDIKTERTVAFEALVRVEFGEQVIAADKIVAAARAHECLHDFDRVAREAAIRFGSKQLQENELLFVNFFPGAIQKPEECLEGIVRVSEETGCRMENLVFEVVESEKFPELAHLRKTFDAFRSRGAKVALDDLGAGNTALTYIKELRPDIVKLDRDLLPTDSDDKTIPLIAGIADYAHLYGITVVAEGIETEVQLYLARNLGIDLGQGWLFGKPSPKALRTAPYEASTKPRRAA